MSLTSDSAAVSGQSPSSTNGKKRLTTLGAVTVRFAGDSGDGMQLAGTQFTDTSALLGNDISTLPDFPAEIRAPAGTLAGVSAFQVHISDHDITTPGDAPNGRPTPPAPMLRSKPMPSKTRRRPLARKSRAR